MASVKVGTAAQIPPGTVAEVEVEGKILAVGNNGGELFAVDGICPHAGGRLGHGALHGRYLACPWHGWEFDCRTGAGSRPLRTYPVRLEGEDVYVEL